MIQLLTKVKIIDNSGGVEGRCIKILKPHGRDNAKIGDTILVSILEIAKIEGGKKGSAGASSIRESNKIKKGTMFKALVVRTKTNTEKKAASYDENAVVLLKSASAAGVNAKKQTKLEELPPIGTRIKGPISVLLERKEEQEGGNTATKVTSLCPKGHLY
jgi:ribosomal protein L14